MLYTTTLGSFTRPDYLIKSIRDKSNDRIGDSALENAYGKATKEVLLEQEKAGIDFPTDGQMRWDDIVTFFASKTRGFDLGGLIRFFDNNLYYRKPSCRAALSREKPIALESFLKARKISRKVKPVLTGPFTLAMLSKNKFYGKRGEFILSLASVIRAERIDLESNGAEAIQIDEPSLVNSPLSTDDWELARQVWKIVSEGASAKLFMATYFGPTGKALPELLEFPCSGIHVDLASFPENWKAVQDNAASFSGKSLGLGCIDARNTKMEDPKAVAKKIAGACKFLDPEKLLVAPSAGLEFLPFVSGVKKLGLLAQCAKLAKNEVV